MRRCGSTQAILVFVLSSACVLGLPGQGDAKRSEPTGLEYKFRLSPKVADAGQRDRLWELVVGTATDDWPDGVKVKSKNCRFVQYVDTDHTDIQRHDFILRHRTKLDDEECTSEIPEHPKGSLALKYRSAEIRDSREEPDKPWASTGESKFEIDLLFSKADGALGQLRGAFSVSAKVEDAAVPATVADVRSVYADALPFLPSSARLNVGCRRIFERVWELTPGHLTSMRQKITPPGVDRGA